jgi:hypothetical protein
MHPVGAVGSGKTRQVCHPVSGGLRCLTQFGATKSTVEPGGEVGVYVDHLPDGATLEVEMRHHRYNIAQGGHTQIRISSHPVFCSEPVMVEIEGLPAQGWRR